MAVMTLAPELRLPWESTAEDERCFRRTLRNMLLIFGALAIAVPLLPVTELSREQVEEPSPQLVKITLEEKSLPESIKPPPAPVAKIPEPPEPVESVKEKHRDEPQTVDHMAQARKVAAVSGLLAFKDDLGAMRDSVDMDALNQTELQRGQSNAANTERHMVTSALVASSGGIKAGALSVDAGGPALSGRETTRVQSTLASTGKRSGNSQPGKLGGRSDESIRLVMDNNKSAIFSIYNRSLRKDPLLHGRLVFEMLIDPSGSVVQIILVSSELSDPALTSKILSRISLINFGADDVNSTRVNYSLDFLPYT